MNRPEYLSTEKPIKALKNRYDSYIGSRIFKAVILQKGNLFYCQGNSLQEQQFLMSNTPILIARAQHLIDAFVA